EPEPNAVFLEHDGHADVGARSLRDRDWELATSQEARFLPAFRDQIRLGEALEQATRLESTDQDAQVVLLTQDEQVQEVGERELARGGCHIRAEVATVL